MFIRNTSIIPYSCPQRRCDKDTRREKYGDENPKTLTSMTHMGGILEKRGAPREKSVRETSEKKHGLPILRPFFFSLLDIGMPIGI